MRCFISSICACVVTYNPCLISLQRLLLTLDNNVTCVYIIDNASHNLQEIEMGIKQLNMNIRLIKNPINYGIGKALNIAIKKALEENYLWMLTFDQDSYCSPYYIGKMFAAINEHCTDLDEFGLCCPLIKDSNMNNAINKTIIYRYFMMRKKQRLMPITSGELIYLPNIIKYGYFDEMFFIDGVDFEYNFRIYKKQGKIIQSSAVLYHNLGNPLVKSIFGIQLIFSGHAPFRYYYMSRNRWLLLYRYKYKAWWWFVKSIISTLYAYISILVICKDRSKYTKAILLGTYDGVRKYIRDNSEIVSMFK